MGRFRPNDRYDRNDRCALSWSELYGTDYEGNLPQHLKGNHVGNCWKPCPYSTQAVTILTSQWQAHEDSYGTFDPYLYIKAMTGLEVVPTLVDHTLPNGKIVYLKYAYKGGWGFECTFPGCTHLLENNKRYFYI